MEPNNMLQFYIAIFCACFGLVFYVLQATRLPQIFKQNKTTQIQIAYFLISIVGAYLITEAIFKIMDTLKNNVI